MKDGYVASKDLQDSFSSMLCISFQFCIYLQMHPLFLSA